MLLRNSMRRRRGVSVVESAVVYPVTFLILLALLVGGLAVFRYQEVAALAREASRYASTHGHNYRKDAGIDTGGTTGSPGTTASPSTANGFLMYQANTSLSPGADTSWCQVIYDNAVSTNMVSLDPSALTCKVGWTPVVNQTTKPDYWPGSTVTVTISYKLTPEYPFMSAITLTSTSTMPITN